MEGNKDSKPRGLLIFGAPCSGKSTFAEKFAKKFGLAYFNLEEISKEYNFNRKQILVLLEQLAKTGRTLVIEGFVDTERSRVEVRNILRRNGYKPALIWIQTDASTIRSRLKTKHKSIGVAKEVYDSAVDRLEIPTEIEFPIILSGKHTFETQSKHAIVGLADDIVKKQKR